jgi:hypothetical protein
LPRLELFSPLRSVSRTTARCASRSILSKDHLPDWLLSLTMQPVRHTLDMWETNMMERDRRLTGSHRGQSVRPSWCCAFGGGRSLTLAFSPTYLLPSTPLLFAPLQSPPDGAHRTKIFRDQQYLGDGEGHSRVHLSSQDPGPDGRAEERMDGTSRRRRAEELYEGRVRREKWKWKWSSAREGRVGERREGQRAVLADRCLLLCCREVTELLPRHCRGRLSVGM